MTADTDRPDTDRPDTDRPDTGGGADRPGGSGRTKVARTPTRRPRRAPVATARGDDATAEPAADDDGGAPATTDPERVGPSWSRRNLPWLLAVAGLIGTVGFATAWQLERGEGTSTVVVGSGSDETSAMLEVARDFSAALTNFDGAEIDRDVTGMADLATGEFRDQLDTFFSSEIRAQLKEAQASSRGEVRDAYVQRSEDDRGTVFVVVDQTIANNRSPQPQADTVRMELGLVETESGWRVNRVAVLSAPTGSSTLPTTDATPGTASDDVGG